MTAHPSGRPIRPRIVKRVSEPQGTSPGYYNARLNKDEPEERAGGMGFVILRESEEDEGMDFGASPTTANRH